MGLDLGTVTQNSLADAGVDGSVDRIQVRPGRGTRAPSSGPVPARPCARGLALAQVGEFGLVLMVLAQSVSLLDRDFSQLIVAAILLSMLVAPVHHSGKRQARAALVEHGMDAEIARAASRRRTEPRDRAACVDRLRLRSYGAAPFAHARAGETRRCCPRHRSGARARSGRSG